MRIDKSDTAIGGHRPSERRLERGRSLLGLGRRQRHGERTVANIERIFQAAKDRGSRSSSRPTTSTPTDQAWQFGGPLERGAR